MVLMLSAWELKGRKMHVIDLPPPLLSPEPNPMLKRIVSLGRKETQLDFDIFANAQRTIV